VPPPPCPHPPLSDAPSPARPEPGPRPSGALCGAAPPCRLAAAAPTPRAPPRAAHCASRPRRALAARPARRGACASAAHVHQCARAWRRIVGCVSALAWVCARGRRAGPVRIGNNHPHSIAVRCGFAGLLGVPGRLPSHGAGGSCPHKRSLTMLLTRGPSSGELSVRVCGRGRARLGSLAGDQRPIRVGNVTEGSEAARRGMGLIHARRRSLSFYAACISSASRVSLQVPARLMRAGDAHARCDRWKVRRRS
jgi:hypothetical protein